MLKYTTDHEWLRVEGDVATIGITPYAQDKLGDLVFVELPSVGARFEQGGPAAVVESVKAASDVFAPVLVNSDPTGEGWLFRIKITDKSEVDALLDEAAYKAILD